MSNKTFLKIKLQRFLKRFAKLNIERKPSNLILNFVIFLLDFGKELINNLFPSCCLVSLLVQKFSNGLRPNFFAIESFANAAQVVIHNAIV